MKFNWIPALVAAILASIGSAGLYAQSSSVYSVSDAVQADLASFVGSAQKGCDAGCESSCGCGKSDGGKGGDAKGGDACEPWRLFPTIGCGWEVNGWVAMGATANADDPASRFNGPVTFNDRERFQFNQLYLSVGRDVDTGGCGLDWGGRVDIMFGSDYYFTQAVGHELHDDGSRHWNRQGNQYGLAMPQMYAEVGMNRGSVKLGHFYTIIGNEVVTAPDNFFYSHAYTMQYGEPFTHMGALGTFEYSDQLTLIGGAVNGWDKVDAETDVASFIGGAIYTPCHERYSLAATFIIGDEDGTAGTTTHTRTMYSIVFGYQITDKLEYVLQHDNGWNEYDAANVADEEWYGLNQYFLYTINDCWKLGARFEVFRDDDGSRMSGIPVRAGGYGGLGIPGAGALNSSDFAGNWYNITLGLNWTPTANLTVRPELRWDWTDGTNVAPFDDLTKDSQMLGAFDIIWLF